MAARPSFGVISALKELTECPICLNTFTDPRALPCMHSLCYGCLQGIIDTATRSSHINCPLCKKYIPIPQPPSADEFPKAFLFNNLCEILHNKQSSENQNCYSCLEDNETVEAGWICIDCADILCIQCKKYHIKNHKSHVCLELANITTEMVNQFLKNKTANVCTGHGKELEYFCKDCTMLLCVACQLTGEEHKQHTTQFVKDKKVQRVYRNKLDEFTTVCVKQLQLYKASMGEIKVKEITKDHEIDNCVQKIDDRCQEMNKMIKQHRDELTQQAERIREQYHTGARLQYEKLTREHDDLERVFKDVARVKNEGTDVDVVRCFTQTVSESDAKVTATPDSQVANAMLELKFDQDITSVKEIYGDMQMNVAHQTQNLGEFDLEYVCSGLAFRPPDQIITVDCNTNNVNIRNKQGTIMASLDTNSPLKNALDVTTYKHDIYVSEPHAGNVYVFDKLNKHLKTVGTDVIGGGGITVQDGTLYMTSYKDESVQKIPLDDFQINSVYLKHEDMKRPRYVAVTPDVAVVTCFTDFGGSNNIIGFNGSGAHLFTHGGEKGNGDNQMDNPADVVIYRNQYVIVADTYNRRLVVLSVAGILCGYIPLEGKPVALDLDDDDNIIVCMWEPNKVAMLKFLPC